MRLAGKLMLIKLGDGESPETFNTVAAQRATDKSQTSESINGTTKDSRWRELIQGGVSGLTINASGLIANAQSHRILTSLAMADAVRNFQLYFGDGLTLTGAFKLESWGVQGDYNGAQQYEMTLQGANIPNEYQQSALLITEGGDAVLLTEGGDPVLILES